MLTRATPTRSETPPEPMQAGLALEGSAFGVPLRILIEDPALRARVSEVLPHRFEAGTFDESTKEEVRTFLLAGLAGQAGHAGPADSSLYRTFAAGDLTLETGDAEAALEQLGRDLMIHVADFAPGRVFVHAGVVAYRGGGLLLPGTSFAGKTTLVAALIGAGATYYSDEYAVLDPEGLAHPYTRDLQMRRPGAPEQRGISPASLMEASAAGTSGREQRLGSDPLRITHILFGRYVPGGQWRPESISPGMAVLEMLLHAIPVQRTPARVLSTLHALVTGARSWRTERDDVSEVVPQLLEALATGDSLVSRPEPR